MREWDNDILAFYLRGHLLAKCLANSTEALGAAENGGEEIFQVVEIIGFVLNEGGVKWSGSPKWVDERIVVLRRFKLLPSFLDEACDVYPE